jgi:hypothetical protein
VHVAGGHLVPSRAGGLVEVFLGVQAVGKSLETITKPLTSVSEKPATAAAAS